MTFTRTVLSILFLSITLMLSAKHLEFMGIPIDGTISNFQTKLQAKGFTLSQYNNEMPVGVRVFNGSFTGRKCNLGVIYSPKSQRVYEVKTVIPPDLESYTLDEAKGIFNELKNLLQRKYDGRCQEDQYEYMDTSIPEDRIWKLFIFDENPLPGAQAIGVITLYYHSDDYGYRVVIIYNDAANYLQLEQEKMDDL